MLDKKTQRAVLELAAFFQDDYTRKLPVIAAFRRWRSGVLTTEEFLARLREDDVCDVLRHEPTPSPDGLAALNDFRAASPEEHARIHGRDPGRFDKRVEQLLTVRRQFPHEAREEVRSALVGLLTDLRRQLAGDSPNDRPPGALEHFDAACDSLGVPFIKP